MIIEPTQYNLPGFTHVYSGKVRDLFESEDGRLLFVASDRISAFDWVLPSVIPDKGRILTEMSLWWFDRLDDIVPNHIISTNVPAAVAGRATYCERLDMLPVECVARGYLSGSGLVEYNQNGNVCGVGLPPGLKDGSKLPKTIFTPATKAAVRGEHKDELVLADEVLTPDSSRFWPADLWKPGQSQPSFDKQYVRDWLLSPESGWDKNSGEAPPELPQEVIEKTRERYIAAYKQLTGKNFN